MENNDNETLCEECNELKDDVRFEGSYEGYICDECFDELVRQRIIYMNVDSFMSVKKVCDNNQGFDYDVYYDKLFSKFREDG